MKKLLPALLAAVVLLASGCAGLSNMASNVGSGSDTLDIQTESRPGSTALMRSGHTIRLAVTDTKDARPVATNPRKIGNIRATVSDMHSTELMLNRDVAALAATAIRSQLSSDGFGLVAPNQAHDFEINTVVRAFELNILGRDELSLAVEVTLREPNAGQVIWSGVVSEKTDRYAGTMGNSRNSISTYLTQGVASLAQKLSNSVRTSLSQAYPQTVYASAMPGQAVMDATGVATLTPAVAREGAATGRLAPVVIPVAPFPVAAQPAAPVQAPAAPPVPLPAPVLPVTNLTLPAPAYAQPPPLKAANTMAAPVAKAPAPEAASGALPGYGYVKVISNPTRVKVYADDIYYGATPLKVMVPVGVMAFEFRFDGYKTVTEKLMVRPGEVTELDLNMKK